MNPLLPEPANNLGRNIFAAKPGAKVDSEDSTRFKDTLRANTPERQKNTASNASDAGGNDTGAQAKGSTPESAAAGTDTQTRTRQSVSESGTPARKAESSSDSETEVEPISAQVDGQSIVLGTAAIDVGTPNADGSALVVAAVSDNSGKISIAPSTTPSVTEAGQSAGVSSGLAQLGSSVTGAKTPAAILESAAAPSVLNTPASAAATPGTGLAGEIFAGTMAGTMTGTGVIRTADPDTTSAPGKLLPNATQVELEKPFASLDADLNLTDAGIDKKNLPGKQVNPGVPFSPQPAYIKSNLDWQFANQMPTLEADPALDISSALKSPSSATGTAYAAVSAVAAMQMNEAVADHRVQMPVNIKFGQPEWAGMVAERTAMMAAQKITFAELQLDPPELGPLQVKVTVQNDQASVNFVSASPAVRDSLEQTAVRLREMLDQEGLDLVDVNVADQSDRQQQNPDDSQPNSHKQVNAEEDISTSGGVNLMTVVASGIDHYV